MLECLHVVNFWNGIDRRVVKDAVKQGLFVVDSVLFFTLAANLLLEPFLFLEMPSKYELSQLLLLGSKFLWEARGADAFFSLNYLHDSGKRLGMHKRVSADDDNSIAHGCKGVFALFIDSAVFFRIVMEAVVFNVDARTLEVCVHVESRSSREVFCDAGNLDLIVGLDGPYSQTTFIFW